MQFLEIQVGLNLYILIVETRIVKAFAASVDANAEALSFLEISANTHSKCSRINRHV